jgi:hypothetical protein
MNFDWEAGYDVGVLVGLSIGLVCGAVIIASVLVPDPPLRVVLAPPKEPNRVEETRTTARKGAKQKES